ncbi:hypothetical protein [Leisingera sp. ANG-DT]|uniref:hypothetical protein n=1 Tax=Leisingera sp. ANG-DT TaxID=1577897 RepID=UPI00057E5481|nr:hypothetical protein [Leisingera sp. ANG-DT]KIC15080.1 hypothetical protein RA21_17655 [Leisingera sp. ANG-DT]
MEDYDRHFRLTETRDKKIVLFEEQYRFLRQEILDRQKRRFFIVAGAALGIPSVSGLKLSGVLEGTFIYVVPLVVVAMSFLFVIEVNGIARAGKFIEIHIEDELRDVSGWEHYLKRMSRDHALNPPVVKVANASFLILMAVYFLFSTLISSWKLLFLGSPSGSEILKLIWSKSVFLPMGYLAFASVVAMVWLKEVGPFLRFSAEEHKKET